MPEINLVIDGKRGEAIERFAALAGKTKEQLVESWIEDRVDQALVVAMRAAGETWEAVATELGVSVTQVRRIYAAGSEFQTIGKDDVKIAEKYLKLLEDIRDITREGDELFPIPDEDDIEAIERYTNALPNSDKIEFPTPDEDDIEAIEMYVNALPNSDNIEFPIPDEDDLERLREYRKLAPEGN